jgi:hypothetical protein
MSAGGTLASTSGTVQVSDHAYQRYLQRADVGYRTKSDIAHRFRHGLRVEVDGKRYEEARFVRDRTALVLLRRDGHVATVLLASEETLRFPDPEERPDLRCPSCEFVRESADDTRPCWCSGSTDWTVISEG